MCRMQSSFDLIFCTCLAQARSSLYNACIGRREGQRERERERVKKKEREKERERERSNKRSRQWQKEAVLSLISVKSFQVELLSRQVFIK